MNSIVKLLEFFRRPKARPERPTVPPDRRVSAAKAVEKPEAPGAAEAALGATALLSGEFDRALWHFLAAREQGYDPAVIDDRLFELSEAMAAAAPDGPSAREAWMRYKSFCPAGRYLEGLKAWEAWEERHGRFERL